jgi:asparaginyl-tRNA synthetase
MSQLFARGRACRRPRSLALPLSPAPRAATRCSSTSSAAPSIAALFEQSSSSSSPPRSPDEPLTLNGFVRSVRKQKRVAFAALGDGSSLKTVQAVLTPEQADGSVFQSRYHTSGSSY